MARRYFVDPLPPPGPVELGGEVGHHLAKVLRVAADDEVVLADGRGGRCAARVTAVRGRAVSATVGEATRCAPPAVRVHLAFAPPRLNRAEWLFEHGTEVGVAVFWPLWTERTRPQGERLERWQKIVRAAAGQCDRDWLPEIRAPLELTAFLQRDDLPAARYLGAGGAPPLRTDGVAEAVLLIGPEGGFAEDEQRRATAAGFLPVGLGPHVLRTETAALIGAALLGMQPSAGPAQPTPAPPSKAE